MAPFYAQIVYWRLAAPFTGCRDVNTNDVWTVINVIGAWLPVFTWGWSFFMCIYTHTFFQSALGTTLVANELLGFIASFAAPDIRTDPAPCAVDQERRPCHESSIAACVLVFYCSWALRHRRYRNWRDAAHLVAVIGCYGGLSMYAPVYLERMTAAQVVYGALIGVVSAITVVAILYRELLPRIQRTPYGKYEPWSLLAFLDFFGLLHVEVDSFGATWQKTSSSTARPLLDHPH